MAVLVSTEHPPVENLRYLKGVGPQRAKAFEKAGIRSIRDLLYYFPRRYEDRSHLKPLADVIPGETVTVKGKILSARTRRIRRMAIMEAVIGDDSGVLNVIWFNQPYLKNKIVPGCHAVLFGKVELYNGRLQLNAPEYEIVDENEPAVQAARITPIYPLTEGLYQRSLRTLFSDVLGQVLETQIQEYLPKSFLAEKALPGIHEAIREMHFPTSMESNRLARRRIVFDEFLLFEITLLRKIERMKAKYKARALKNGEQILQRFAAALPFPLTASQEESILALSADMERSYPMNRLLMGDVGSGKTVVAAFAMLLCVLNGHQGAFLIPTEILARQHYETLKRFLAPFSVTVKLLTAGTAASAREKMLAELRQGKINCVVGTHALLAQGVNFKDLALVVIDEQHKFGVYQRCLLLDRDPRPHQLVMTATPIPRTLALTVYGDLDVSAMKELPAGRQPIKTYWITRAKQKVVLEHILEKLKAGEQAYFIFPMIEETEKADLLAAKTEYEKLSGGVFRNVRLGLVHGRMPAEERDQVMRSFREGDIKALIATSVIEVGVDNPNATVMVIENAERFGLSQLHQMRGRIGRGSRPSECFLFGEPSTDEGKKRLRILTKTQDGFVIAEEDLRLRGPGDFWGVRQSGEPFFRMADPVSDQDVFMEARSTAVRLVNEGFLTSDPLWVPLKNYLDQSPIRY